MATDGSTTRPIRAARSPWGLTEAPKCQNGIDDDGDGLVDFGEDPGCATYADISERDPNGPACDNGRDDDGDRLSDFPLDPGCAGVTDDSERDPALVCDDGIDGDGDGLVDFPADAGCSSPTDASETSEDLVCDDGRDNDGDGLTDFPADPGCSGQRDSSERSPSLVCDDGVDNDGDGLTDFPADPACTSPTYPSELEACRDGLDNDGDGRVDFPADAGCSSATDASEIEDCDDGIDNDGDGRIDFPADAGCSSARDGSERDPALACDDGLDNDADGLADFPADPGCSSPTETSEVSSCQDGVDNDSDGRIDFPADPECASAVDDWEAPALRYRGLFQLDLTIGSSLPALVLPGSGVALANFPLGPGVTEIGIAGGDFAGVAAADVTDLSVFPIAGLQLSVKNAPGFFSGSGAMGLAGRMPLDGVAKLCLFASCEAGLANLSIPLSVVGVGGSAFATGAVNLTAEGAPWTTGTVAVGTATAMGSAGPGSATTNAGGTVTLVTPIFISTDVSFWAGSHGFAFLTLEFIPEPSPGFAGLIASGIVGLVALGRSQRRRSQERRAHVT